MHFYEATETGVEARHFVPLVSRPGEIRPTRISDVRKMWAEGRDVVPSVTTVLNVLAKPGLENWKIDRHLTVAFDAAINMNQRDDWIAEVRRLTELEMDKAPTAGSDLHKSLEEFFRGNLDDSHDDYRICHGVHQSIEMITGYRGWEAERRFVSPLGYGGQVDLCGGDWVIDFKTKQTADKFKPGKMAFDEHVMQLAAYREGLGLPRAKAANVFICLEDGQVNFHEHTEEELQRGWRMFQHALALWQEQNQWKRAA